MQRVAVIGCGGSGKTSLANELARQRAIPVIHLDSYYWQLKNGDRVASTVADWEACHRRLIAQDAWILDGMKLGVLHERLNRADTIIYLDLPTHECLTGIIRRRVRYRGREDEQTGVYDRITLQFLRWVWSFRRVQRPLPLEKLQDFDGNTIVLQRRRDVRQFLDTVTSADHPGPRPPVAV